VKAYSGYINLPSSLTGESFDIHTFYWFFESRKDPANAPFSIYLSGGPAETSMDGVTGDGGPCNINADSKGTTLNPWSFNNEVNMIYIDQPVQTGFSYDSLINGTLDLLVDPESDIPITARKYSSDFPVNITTKWGTFPSQDLSKTSLGSASGATALWHFMQVWVTECVFSIIPPKPFLTCVQLSKA
jgi:carboxypeptidase C (cathepsin A)